jgi:galactokinase
MDGDQKRSARVSCWAPGRVNLIGEHTDYSGGLVLPIAIQLGITLTYEPAEEMALKAPGGERYAAAVEQELAALGRPDVRIAAVIESDLPQGAGLGSSGAFEVAVGLALCDAADFELEPLELALACQRAERRAVGVPSGILDQAASLLGREGHSLLLDCGSLDYRWIELPHELGVVVVDSGERHSLEGSGYGKRRRELELGDRRRVRHVESENDRVRAVVEALERDDVAALGPLFAASHASLRDDYEVSTPTLDAVVEAALAAGAVGARMTGGGFGGSVVAVTGRENADDVLRGTLERAGTEGLIVQAAEGATRRRTDSLPDLA